MVWINIVHIYGVVTYLHTEQYSCESNEANARYHWILGGGTLSLSSSQGCMDPVSPNLAKT